MRTVPRGVAIIELASSFLSSGLQVGHVGHLYKELVVSLVQTSELYHESQAHSQV